MRDFHALDGKFAGAEAHFELVVVGAGERAIAAAMAAVQAGATVLLVDENPLPAASLRGDIPLWFGGRMTGAVDRPERMLETLLETNPAVLAAVDAGVEVLPGTCVWGLYVPQPGLATLPGPVVALADTERSWLVGFDKLIVAAGARDFVAAFPGWDVPGVVGAKGFEVLVARYRAFAGRRLVILGSGDLAVATAQLALAQGLEVAALVECGNAAVAEVGDLPVLFGHRVVRAVSGVDGVEAIVLRGADGEVTLACDTICAAVSLVPAVELLAAAGARMVVDGARGGVVPELDAGGESSLANVFAIGDCAAIAGVDALAERARWHAALGQACTADTIVCQCEAVTRADILGVQPPRYLGERQPAMAARDLGSLLHDGPPDQDQIKRLTRAGMGVCQGRRCRDQVALLLAEAAGLPPGRAPHAGYRFPVRPLPLQVMADWAETPAMTAGWDVWFGIAEQWTPYRDIGTEREAMHQAVLGGNMHL